jgi:hypothetical protein
MPLSQDITQLKESGLLTDEDLSKLASLEANMIEASSEDLETLVGVIADMFRSEGFNQEDFLKCAQLIEDEGLEFDAEKLAARFDFTSGWPTLKEVMAGLGRGLAKHKGKIAPAFLTAMTLALGTQALLGTKAQQSALKQSLEQIKKQYPELKADKMTDQHFGALSTFSPTIAQNPIVAGNLLLKMKQWGTIDHKTIQDLIQMEKNLAETRETGMGFGLSDVVRTTGALHQMISPRAGIFDVAPIPAAGL